MNALPRRLLNALTPQPGMPREGVEPRLLLDSLPPLHAEDANDEAAPGRRFTIEQLLDEGSQRVYEPMQEAEVIETRT